MKWRFILIGYLVCLPYLSIAQKYTIGGRIIDAETKEVLVGCSVFDNTSHQGVVTNNYGLYSLQLKEGSCHISTTYLGYEPASIELVLTKDTVINIALYPQTAQLAEVVVSSGNRNLQSARLGTVNVPISHIKKIPTFFGENDLMKSLQYVPGVQNTSEGKSDLSVRGGSPDQNLILLDGIPIYNANHVFGFFSVFNTDALKNVNLYKSGFPARFGGRLSSVIDITTKDGNKEHFAGSATLGLLALKFNLEGPIIKDKTSFTFSARRSHVDLYMKPIQDWLNDDDSKENGETNFYFYDINAKLHHKLNDKTSLYLIAYKGQDRLTDKREDGESSSFSKATTRQNWDWGSTIFATKLNSIITNNLFLNATLSYNQYDYMTSVKKNNTATTDEGNSIDEFNNLDYNSGIKDYTANVEIEYIPTSQHYIRSGLSFIYHDFSPEVISHKTNETSEGILNKNVYAKELSFYAEDDWDITRKLRLNGGFRYSLFNVNNTTYQAIDPRLAVRYLITNNFSLKAGYSHMQQYIHLLSSNSLLLQTDLWVPVTDKVKPMYSNQYSIGIYSVIPNLFDVSIETYYKDMDNVVEYKDGASFTGISTGWESKVESGIGRSYGIELSLERKTGKTTGVVSYALAKTERKFNEINYGEWFPAKYDRRHTINLNINQQLSKKMDLSLNWIYASGDMATIPMMSAVVADIPESQIKNPLLEQLDHRNNYRLPAHHRLDIGLNYTTNKKGNRYGVWNFSLYNVYNRMNTFNVFIEEEDLGKAENGQRIYTRKLKQLTLFPIMPSVSYTYNF